MDKQARKNKLLKLFKLQQFIRDFFLEDNFLDVLTPPMVENPGMETHIHPFRVNSAKDKKNLDQYLHTSPEFHMKGLLSKGFEKIFSISYCFRDEPSSGHHRPQFLMLEWYRSQSFYKDIMNDVEELVKYCSKRFIQENFLIKEEFKSISPIRMTIQEVFQQELGIDILCYLEKSDLSKLIRSKFKDVPLPSEEEDHLLSWDDYYFLLFLNKIEPNIKKYPFLLLYEFPHHLSALSTIKESDPRVCERFEVYCHGIELCNCFNELTNLEVQKKRFSEQATLKKQLYGYELPEAEGFYKFLESGLPKASGIALGVERLLMAITGEEDPFYL